MGRRLRGAALRAKKRGREAQNALVDTAADKAETKAVEDKADDELFMIDTDASSTVNIKAKEVKRKAKRDKQSSSAKEQKQILRLVNAHSLKSLQQMVQDGKKTASRAKRKGKVTADFDLWDSSSSSSALVVATSSKGSDSNTKSPLVAAASTTVTTSMGSTMAGIKPHAHTDAIAPPRVASKPKHAAVAIDIAKSGQSYNPDKVEHKKIVDAAVEVELRREQAEKEKSAPIATGMSEETKALLLGDSDTEDESDDDDNDDGDGDETQDGSKLIIQKKKEKMTRAERNKQKRLRQEKVEVKQRKRQKKLMNAVGEAKVVAKHIRKEEAKRAEEKAKIESLKAASKRTKGKDIIHQLSNITPITAPTVPVALSADIKKTRTGGGLRAIKPKGSLITDRMTSFADRDMSAKKAVKRKKRVEGKRRRAKVKVHGKGHKVAKEGELLG